MTEVTDAQVFEAMGWELVPGVWASRTSYVNSYWRARDNSYTFTGRQLPPVMSNPSSPEAWAVVPVMLAFISEREWYFGLERGFGDSWQLTIAKDGTELGFGDSTGAELPRPIGEAIVRATSEEGAG